MSSEPIYRKNTCIVVQSGLWGGPERATNIKENKTNIKPNPSVGLGDVQFQVSFPKVDANSDDWQKGSLTFRLGFALFNHFQVPFVFELATKKAESSAPKSRLKKHPKDGRKIF